MNRDHLAIRGLIFHLDAIADPQLVVSRCFPVTGDLSSISPHPELLGAAVRKSDQEVAMVFFNKQHTLIYKSNFFQQLEKENDKPLIQYLLG